jgi:aryl-alcohol dehydrogenase-like predicted oxidoreductase
MLRRNIDRSRQLISALEEIAAKRNVTPAQVALNWLIHGQGETVVAIPGASKVHHAEQSAGAMDFRLEDEEMDRIDQLSRQFR